MTYLFDIGNVLLAFDFAPALERISGPNAKSNAYDKIIEKKDQFEAGQISIPEYLKFVYELLDYQGSDTEFFATWNSIFTPILPTWELANTLADQGHRLILFSNTNPIHAPYCLESYGIFEIFHHAVFSHEIGAIKPDSKFFTRAFEKFNIIPEETIYIDDLPDNIATGKALGLHSFCYEHLEQVDQYYTSFDSDPFPYRNWNNSDHPETVIIAIHGINGAAQDYQGLGSYLSQHLPSSALYAPETRGQGNDPNKVRRGDIYS